MTSWWGVVVAGGAGTRFGGPKHDVLLGDLPLWRHARDTLLEGGAESVVVVGDVSDGIPGGSVRRESVAAGLSALPDSVQYVLVHDAARPLATPALVRLVIDRLRRGDVDGVIPAIPVRDALKRIREAGDLVAAGVSRAGLVAVQTPQGFAVSSLRRAHESATGDADDDAELIEAAGGTVAVVPGEPANLKVTFPADLAVAAALYSAGVSAS